MSDTAPQTGRETGPFDSLAHATVHPNTEGLGAEGPRDVDDLIVHTGEARSVADTARHSLEPDAPTVGAAQHEVTLEEDQADRSSIPRTDNAPD